MNTETLFSTNDTTIFYTKIINVPNAKLMQMRESITHDELDKWTNEDFANKGFIEVLLWSTYRRVYIDFDEMQTEAEVDDVFDYLETLTEVFGEYVYAGTSTDADIASKYNLTYIDMDEYKAKYPNAKTDLHKVSIHVVFYQVCMHANDLNKLFGERSTYSIHDQIDHKPYKDVGSKQNLRHPCANKLFSKTVYKMNAADVASVKSRGVKLSQLVATCDGSETLVTLDDLVDIIPLKAEPQTPAARSAVVEADDEIDPDTVDEIDPDTPVELFERDPMPKELFEALYEGFAGLKIHGDVEHCDKEITLFPLFSALYACVNDNIDEDDVQDALDFIKEHADLTTNASEKWSEKRKQAKKNDKCKGPGALFKYVRQFNPDYFNRTVKPLLPHRKPVVATCDLADKFCAADVTIKAENYEYQGFDKDNKYLAVNDSRQSSFVFDYEAALNDLKRCMIVINKAVKTFYFKELDGFTDAYIMVEYKQTDAKEYLKSMILGTEYKVNDSNDNKLKKFKSMKHITADQIKSITTNKITAFDLYSTHQSLFSYKAAAFYSTNPEVYSIFKWYKHKPTETYDMSLIQPFIDFIHDVIANGRDNVASYLNAWFQSILKNPTYKTGVAVILKGKQGTGKNTFTDTLCSMLGEYALTNVSNIDNLTGRFNVCIINKKLIVVNELKSAENHAIGTADVLKTLITDYYMNLEQKCVDVKSNVVQVANFIINTNNIRPLTISEDDRRMCVLTPNAKYANDKEYFMKLRKTMFVNPEANDSPYRDDFMQALLSWYWYTDFGIKPEQLRNIPQTDERKDLIDISRPFTFNFVAKYFDEFNSSKGIEVADTYQKYLSYFNEQGYGKKLNYNELTNILKTEYCTKKQLRRNGLKPWLWFLNKDLNVYNQLKEAYEQLSVPVNVDLGDCDADDDEETAEQKRERLLAEMARIQEQLDNIPVKQ